jgi:HK97 family phage major capsid protein
MSGRIVQRIFETSPMRAYASVQVISTDALEGYYDNDETGFGWVGELEVSSSAEWTTLLGVYSGENPKDTIKADTPNKTLT